MEEKYDALVLRAIDYKDNDKLLTLFAAGKGKMTAVIKGVKKGTAKLKFAAQPFCFAEYVFAQKSNRYIVISAFSHDGFYALREDVNKFYAASAVLEVCNLLLPEDSPSDELFICAVQTLGLMCEGDESLALISFLIKALRLSGYALYLGDCPDCGEPVGATPYFDFERGAFCCKNCPTPVRASEETLLTLRIADGKTTGEPSLDGKKRALRLLREYFAFKTDYRTECLSEYIRII